MGITIQEDFSPVPDAMINPADSVSALALELCPASHTKTVDIRVA